MIVSVTAHLSASSEPKTIQMKLCLIATDEESHLLTIATCLKGFHIRHQLQQKLTKFSNWTRAKMTI